MSSTGKSSLANQVMSSLLMEITSGKYCDSEFLPPENELAKEMGVSRTAIRDGLSILEREGVITRSWGKGTIINHHVVRVVNRIDLEKEFLDMVRDCGFEAAVKEVKVDRIPADRETAKLLEIRDLDPVYAVERIVTADGVPAILCIDYFAESLIVDHDFDESELTEPIFDFLIRRCQTDVFLEITHIKAENADSTIAGLLGIEVGKAVLHLIEIGYDVHGKPIMISDEYYREGGISHSVIRKKM